MNHKFSPILLNRMIWLLKIFTCVIVFFTAAFLTLGLKQGFSITELVSTKNGIFLTRNFIGALQNTLNLPLHSQTQPQGEATPKPKPFDAVGSETIYDNRLDIVVGDTVDVELKVSAADSLEVRFLVQQFVDSSLITPSGKVVARVKANSPEAEEPFAGFTVDAPEKGIWTLHFVNTGKEDGLAFISAGIVKNKLQ